MICKVIEYGQAHSGHQVIVSADGERPVLIVAVLGDADLDLVI
jgi:hypothetical protein